ncbi:hypothetical protein Nepgr_002890 [Nepenthes gracilis]|uniref:Uncharacterized protein n=1 Tax=Nepenthes gracilis TaxID=150966 RepID=A0AAD3P7N7_NEPGR|nr:hypothetical protein Nepgr_002890 [Nepenthes gracilis]
MPEESMAAIRGGSDDIGGRGGELWCGARLRRCGASHAQGRNHAGEKGCDGRERATLGRSAKTTLGSDGCR